METVQDNPVPMTIYWAGPLFSLADRSFNLDMKHRLGLSGFEVWLPQEHEPRDGTAQAIFEVNCRAIDHCDVMIANMDGADVDSGTAWEVGYAYGRRPRMPIILFRTDFRNVPEGSGFAPFNLMLSCSAIRLLTPSMTGHQLIDRIRIALSEF